jgi:hypothetical protein
MLIEKIILVGIKEKSNKISLDYKDYLIYGAIMMDLVLKDKISISRRNLQIEILNDDPTNDVILDKMLDFINTSRGNKSLIDVCSRFMKRSNKSDFMDVITSKLDSSGFIKYLGKKRLQRRYEVKDPALKTKILNEINAVLIDNQEPSKELMFLLSLLRIESNFSKIIPKKSRKIAETRLINLVRHESIGKALQDYIDEMKEEAQELVDDIFDDD